MGLVFRQAPSKTILESPSSNDTEPRTMLAGTVFVAGSYAISTYKRPNLPISREPWRNSASTETASSGLPVLFVISKSVHNQGPFGVSISSPSGDLGETKIQRLIFRLRLNARRSHSKRGPIRGMGIDTDIAATIQCCLMNESMHQ